jgi:hypothetical protein
LQSILVLQPVDPAVSRAEDASLEGFDPLFDLFPQPALLVGLEVTRRKVACSEDEPSVAVDLCSDVLDQELIRSSCCLTSFSPSYRIRWRTQ